MIILYDYNTGRILRKQDGSPIVVDETRETPHSYKQNKRWINVKNLNTMDIAYIYVENELAVQENLSKIEFGVDTTCCIV